MASWLLSLLSTEVDTSLTCLQHPGVVDAHIRHGSRESSSAQEETAWTFAVVSAEPKTVGTLVHSRGCFALLLRLIQRPPEEVRLQAAWALANLSLQPKATAHLLSLCAVSHLVGTLRTAQSEALIHQAMRCLGTLLTDAQARAQLLEMCGEAGDASWALAFFARHASSPAEALQETALRALVHSLAQPFSLSHTFLELPGAEGIERLCGVLTDQESLSDRRAGIVCSAVLQLALATTSRDASTARDEATFPTPLTQCIEPVLSIAATLGGRSPFLNMQNVDDEDEREEVARNRAKLSANCPSDHIIGAKAVQQWLDASNKSQFCKSLGLSFDAMRSIKQQRDAFARDLAGLGFVSRGGGGGGRGDLNANGNSDRVVSAVRKRLLLGRCNATIVTNSALVYNYPPGFVCGAVQERGSSMEADTEVRGDIWGDGRGEGRGEGIAVLPVASGGYGWCTEQAVQVRSGDRAGDQQALQR